MSQLLLHKKTFRKNSKGVSGILATIFMVIIVLFLYSQVYIFTQNEDARFEAGVREANQLDIDVDQEKLTFSNLNYVIEEDTVHVQTKVTNEGPVSVEIATLWVVDIVAQKYGYNDTINLYLKVGETLDFTGSNALLVSIEDLPSSNKIASWFVTSRGNRISIETHIQNIVVANVAQGIGALALDLDIFRHFTYETTDKLANFPTGTSGFDVPEGEYIGFGCYLTNYDPQERAITIDSHSLFFQIGPGGAEYSFYIINVATNGSILSMDVGTFTDITINYGEEKMLVFASDKDIGLGAFSRLKTAIAVDTVATFVLLHGTIGSTPFAQNIPYVSLYYN
ncbi:MAG: hypothetical protein JSW14_06060 [Candidatus Bathyarchaeum sp.]|nr:MAG: hypothetical protein JSW14_06060 [Candidatus Bathyarchaeum sp.]